MDFHNSNQRSTQAAYFMAACFVSILWAGTGTTAGKGIQAVRDPESGQLVIVESGKKVLQYNYKTIQPPEGFIDSLQPGNVKYARARSNYIHPLYGPDGEELTFDWSKDHPHHRGIYWAWPEVDWQAKRGDSHALQHVFVRPTGKVRLTNGNGFAQIEAENRWLWEDKTTIAAETVIIKAHRMAESGRHIDLTFRIEAIKDDVTLARRGTTHYGGLNIRLSPIKDMKLIHHADPADAKPRMAWSDSIGIRKGGTKPVGFAVFEKPANPDYPGDWIEYPYLPWFQPTFPAAGTRYVLKKGKPLVLNYRLWIRRAGETSEAEYRKQWKKYTGPADTPSLPERGAASRVPARRWEEAFVTGNGRMGAMLFGNPENETLVANHCRLFLPLGSREIVPDLAPCLSELRRIIHTGGYRKAMDFILQKAKAQGFPGLLPTDPLHPGFFVHIRQDVPGGAEEYVRTQDFRTGEVAVRWRDRRGRHSRRLFVSRTHNLIVLSLTGPGKGGLDCELDFPPLKPAERQRGAGGWQAKVKTGLIVCGRNVKPDCVTYHNTYAMGKGGYDAAVRIETTGGRAELADGKVKISAADEVLLLVRIVPWKTPMLKERSEAWAYAPVNPDFSKRAGQFVPVPPPADSSVVPYLTGADAEALMPQLVKSLSEVNANYDALLAPHARAHASLFERVSLDLESGEERKRTSADLLAETRKSGRLSPALMEKMYDAGRYMFICCAGELPPNLQGIWTGSWKPAWSGDFTLDTNLQLAMKHAFSGNLGELMEGYFRMIEDFLPEWRINAKRTYGCDGIMTNARASNTALLLHWGTWPGIFWTSGCGWLAHFFYDQWQFTGDERFLRERTVPLLKEVAAFYEDFVVQNKQTGRLEFIPSYSPETGAGITATMDVMVLKDALKSLITACRVLDIDADRIPKLEAMLAKLPDYRINNDGALAEWIPEGGPERYRHRHLSHLHSCYEALDDIDREANPKLWKAAQEATRRRIHSGGEVSSHGRVHMALAAAFLEMAEEAYGRLEVMAAGASMYDSLMCSHEPNQRIFNVDANGAIPEIVNRMLVRSHPGTLDLLPALPRAWPRGGIRGIRARQQITIDRLSWDSAAKELALEITSGRDQVVKVGMPAAETILKITSGEGARLTGAGKRRFHRVQLKAGSPVNLTMEW